MSIHAEFQKTISLLHGSIFEGCFNPPATNEQIFELEKAIGMNISGGLRELWLLANGAQERKYGTPVFGVFTDEPTPCGFSSIQKAISDWQEIRWEEDIDNKQKSERDSRIKTGWFNLKWLPFATFNGYATIAYYDGDPAPGGRVGQIIAYQHDPDAIYLVANSFEEFYERSNQLLSTDTFLVDWIKDK